MYPRNCGPKNSASSGFVFLLTIAYRKAKSPSSIKRSKVRLHCDGGDGAGGDGGDGAGGAGGDGAGGAGGTCGNFVACGNFVVCGNLCPGGDSGSEDGVGTGDTLGRLGL